MSLLMLVPCVTGASRAAEPVPIRAGDPKAGDDVFIKCSGCHQIGPGAVDSIGPNLNGVVGRPSAVVSDFAYSDAMRNARVRWDHDTLASFLAHPQAAVQGTKMAYGGLKDRQDIEDLIAYLSAFDKEGASR